MTQLYLGVILALALFAGLQTWRIDLLEEKNLKAQVEQGKATIRQLDAAQLQTAAWQEKVNEANESLERKDQELQATRRSLRAELDGLRNDLATAASKRDLSPDACPSHVARIRLVEELFVRCTERYSGLAEKAQQLKNYAEGVLGSWPRSTATNVYAPPD